MNDLDFCVICGGTIEAGDCGTCTCDEEEEEVEKDAESKSI